MKGRELPALAVTALYVRYQCGHYNARMIYSTKMYMKRSRSSIKVKQEMDFKYRISFRKRKFIDTCINSLIRNYFLDNVKLHRTASFLH